MYIILEHNGTPAHLEFVERLKDYLEDTYGAVIEDSVGRYDNDVVLYSEKLVPLCTLQPSNDPFDYLKYVIEEDE